jgi:hypothetical protein
MGTAEISATLRRFPAISDSSNAVFFGARVEVICPSLLLASKGQLTEAMRPKVSPRLKGRSGRVPGIQPRPVRSKS